ncbi:MAG: hypothetical protein IKL53_05895 [Lachnospiraceae bacterium]|nr:hypothetical protein [Lachnospiraceae bacterium]
MYYINMFLILFIIWAAIFIARGSYRSNQARAKATKNFWERESQANLVRKADISGLDYLSLDLSVLPMSDAAQLPNLKYALRDLKSLTDCKIINLSMYSNTDLKSMYGPANLQELTEYDYNYTKLIRSLNTIGKELYNSGNPSAAKEFLSYALSIGSDISETFTLLATIYVEAGHPQDINLLLKLADGLKTINKDSIINKLNNIKSNVK